MWEQFRCYPMGLRCLFDVVFAVKDGEWVFGTFRGYGLFLWFTRNEEFLCEQNSVPV